jgi:hypothetical protein
LFTHDGSLWQCRQSTGQTPGGPHWLCVAHGASRAAAPDEDAVQERQITKAVGQLRAEVEMKIAEMKERMGTISGKLPIANAWAPETVTYASALVTHDGACWQAVRDTARPPGASEDWVLIARAGDDGVSPTARGEFDPKDAYGRLDIVIRDGSSFIATQDNPGVPGEGNSGWQLLALRGPKGEPGMAGSRGRKGDQGPPGPMIVDWRVSDYKVVPFTQDGAGPVLDLFPMLTTYRRETTD